MSTSVTATDSDVPDYDLNLPPNPLDDFSAGEREAHEHTLKIGNSTAVGPKEGRGKRDSRSKWLDKHNRDNKWKYREDVAIWQSADTQYKIGLISAFGLQLGMSDLLIQKAINQMMEIDLARVGLNVEEVGFCICGLVVKKNAEEQYGEGGTPDQEEPESIYNPFRNDENNPDAYVTLENRIIERFERASESRIQSFWTKFTGTTLPKRKNRDWKPIVRDEARVPLCPPAVRTQFEEEELD